VQALELQAERADLRSSSGTCSASTPNCFGPPPIFMPEDLSSKSGLTRTATRAAREDRAAMSAARRASRNDSRLIRMPALTACASSRSVLPGPAKLISCAGMPLSSATRSSPPEATSRPSTRPARWQTSAGIGLAFMA
jgi:hypothetical protein